VIPIVAIVITVIAISASLISVTAITVTARAVILRSASSISVNAIVVMVAIAIAVIAIVGPGMTGTAVAVVVAVAVMAVEVRSFYLRSLDVAEELHGMRMFGGNFRKYIELGLVGKLGANVQYRYNAGTGAYVFRRTVDNGSRNKRIFVSEA
jgi:hypothetical protein